MMDKKFVKLSSLVNDTFTVKEMGGYTFKLWDNEQRKMLTSDTYVKGYRKIYTAETDKGTLDLGAGQLGNLLEAVFTKGKADLIGKTFEVKSNGKSGLDIRYFFNVKKNIEPGYEQEPVDVNEPINLDDIPF